MSNVASAKRIMRDGALLFFVSDIFMYRYQKMRCTVDYVLLLSRLRSCRPLTVRSADANLSLFIELARIRLKLPSSIADVSCKLISSSNLSS